ncbi:hypothetical protein SAMN04488136_1743 [Vibrio xiamenensis]|uniref:Gp37 protein n=1 Tax=Vibrio xiamenensis TaxID=861298 RepID=A0A1G8I0M9_9VIBR|nr:hypothetical protein [Vibrio xiamenensis]SDI12479.1 hypothetical protein SAMN04488136_1743 [Vibrio xiamenensis]
MQSTLNKPSDYYQAMVTTLKDSIRKATVVPYKLYGEYQVKGVECHVAIDEYGKLQAHNDGRIKQPVRVKVYCMVSKAESDAEFRNSDLIAQDLASAVGRIAFNNNFGLNGAVSLPSNVVSQQGLFKSGADGYDCWETEWWQDLFLGELADEGADFSGLFLAINPEHPELADEYEDITDAITNSADSSV